MLREMMRKPSAAVSDCSIVARNFNDFKFEF